METFAPLLASDDDATLEAALNLIDDCEEPITQHSDNIHDDELTNFLDVVDGHGSARPCKGVVVLACKPRRRRTPKQEIGQLRLQQRELTTKLENLRLEAFDRNQVSKLSKSLPFWKRIASRQQQNRLDSERENRRLRSLVAMHIGRVKRLKIAWSKEMAFKGVLEGEASSTIVSHNLEDTETTAILEALAAKIGVIYADLDNFLSGRRQYQVNQIVFIDHLETSLLPFERQAVESAMWKAFATRFNTHQRQIKVTANTITSSVFRTLCMVGLDVQLRVRWVTKKFHEAERTVVITTVFIEPQNHDIPAGVHFEETQISIVTGLPNNGDATSATTNIDTHVRVIGSGPNGGNGDGMRWWATSPGGIAAQGAWMQAIRLRKDAVEDCLFEATHAI